MRVKEWHTISVGGRPVNHDLEPVVYRKGKTNVRIEGMWYCAECDDVVDMKRLNRQGSNRRTRGLPGRYTSMFQKGLRFEKKPRKAEEKEKEMNIGKYPMLSEPAEEMEDEEIGDNEEKGLGNETINYYFDAFKSEKSSVENALDKGKYPGTRPKARCPCGSGKKYKKCCGSSSY